MTIKALKLVTPISHLFNNESDADDIAKCSDELEARERTASLRFNKTTHYHLDFDLNNGISNKQKDFLHEHVKNREEIQTLTFQLTRDSENYFLSNGRFFPKGLLINEKDQLKRSKESIKISFFFSDIHFFEIGHLLHKGLIVLQINAPNSINA